MICYIDDKRWGQYAANIPAALQQKKFAQLENHFARAGFPTLAGEKGWLQVATAGRSLAETITFLAEANIAAVTVEPADIPNWLGRGVISLAVKRALETDGAEALGLSLLEPDELTDALQHAQWILANNNTDHSAEGDYDLQRVIAEDDLRNHNLLTPEMDKAYEDFYREPEPQPQPDLSEYFPSADDDPWRQ